MGGQGSESVAKFAGTLEAVESPRVLLLLTLLKRELDLRAPARKSHCRSPTERINKLLELERFRQSSPTLQRSCSHIHWTIRL